MPPEHLYPLHLVYNEREKERERERERVVCGRIDTYMYSVCVCIYREREEWGRTDSCGACCIKDMSVAVQSLIRRGVSGVKSSMITD